MWDSCTLQGSIQTDRLLPDPARVRPRPVRTAASPPGLAIVSILVPSVETPCRGSLRRRGLPRRQPRDCPLGLSVSIRRSLAGTAGCRDRRRAPNPRYRNEAGESCSSLAFATARREVPSGFPYASSRTLHRAESPLLSKWVSGPSCASRRLFRRNHLRLQRGPCGPPSNASPGVSKDRPSVVYSQRVHSHRGVFARRRSCPKADTVRRQSPKLRNQRGHRRSSFRLRGFAPP